MTTFGLWLGDRHFSISMYENGKVTTFERDATHKTYPLLISFRDNSILFGEDAMDNIEEYRNTMLYNLLRFIGRSNSEEYVKNFEKLSLFHFEKEDEHLEVKVKFRGEELKLSPASLLALEMYFIKKLLKKKSGKVVNNLTIAIPEQYTSRQFKLLKECAKIVGIKNVTVQYESEMFACYFHSVVKRSANLRFISFIGNEFCVMNVDVNNDKTIKTTESIFFGCDEQPCDLIVSKLIDKLESIGIRTNYVHRRILTFKINELIEELRSNDECSLDLTKLREGLVMKYTKNDFDEVMEKILDDLFDAMEKIGFKGISDVAIFGDFCRSDEFIKSVICSTARQFITPDNSVGCSIGAALYGAGVYKIIPTFHHNICMRGGGDKPVKLGKRNSLVTSDKSRRLEGKEGNDKLSISLYEGDGCYISDYTPIGKIRLQHEFNSDNKEFDLQISRNDKGVLTFTASNSYFNITGNITEIDYSGLGKSVNFIINALEEADIIRVKLNRVFAKFMKEINKIKAFVNSTRAEQSNKDCALKKLEKEEEFVKNILNRFPEEEFAEIINKKIEDLEMIDITCAIPLQLE